MGSMSKPAMLFASSRAMLCALTLLATPTPGILSAQIVVSEIMYHPPDGELEYIELTNIGAAAVDLGGWAFTDGVRFTFPAATLLPANDRLVVCRARDTFLAAYPDVAESAVFGDYDGALANSGERLIFSDAVGAPQQTITYDDTAPWDVLADGFGAALERLCLTAAEDDPANWRASRLVHPGTNEDPAPDTPGSAFAPTPAAGNSVVVCPPPAAPPGGLFLSEIMYHPVREDDFDDNHEFIEIASAAELAVDLSGWRLVGLRYTFPEGSAIAPGELIVLAKNPARLLELEDYDLDPSVVFGPYAGSLDNGGERLALVTADGRGVDAVRYDDGFPWPDAADALGAEAGWLDEALLPLNAHQFRGVSLERVSFDVAANEVANWEPSPVDAPTPGRINTRLGSELRPIVTSIDVEPSASASSDIFAADDVRVEVEFAPRAPIAPTLEFFVEDLESDDELRLELPLSDNGSSGDLEESDGTFTALLPPQPENSIVRYRVRGSVEGFDEQVLSPRPSDAAAWHAYFVAPEIDTTTRTYHLFISRDSWGKLNTNLSSNRVSDCDKSPTWNAREPAVFVHNGRVIDARVRFQGSRWNRTSGEVISNWQQPGPSSGTTAVRSWRLAFPRYRQLEGRSVVIMNKLRQSCPGHNSVIGFRLFTLADIPSPETTFVRFHINGGYYRYMLEYERPGEDMIRRYNRDQSAKYPDKPSERVGHLFKSIGCSCDEGPFGWGDWRLLTEFCGHDAAARYAATYDRKTHEWASHDELITLIEDLHTARAEGNEALRQYFLDRFDLDRLFDYVAIMNWSVPFDDMFQNHFIYQRLSDGRWMLAPWDLDRNYGEWKSHLASFFMGEQGDRDNRGTAWHRLKDGFLKGFRDEYTQHLLMLNNELLSPKNILPLVDELSASVDQDEANAAAARLPCTFAGRDASFRRFVVARHELINEQLAGVRVEPGPDQLVFVGEVASFDATATTPPPGPDVAYSWSNGMEGTTPEFAFATPGLEEITLTVTTLDIDFEASLSVEILPKPETVYRADDGLVTIEAENAFMNLCHGSELVAWETASDLEGFSGRSYMHATQLRRQTFRTNYTRVAPELRFAIEFDEPGVYHVWIRAFTNSSGSDSLHVGLDGKERDTLDATDFEPDEVAFTWSGADMRGDPQEIIVETPGTRVVSLWVRESNLIVDKLILTRDRDFVPQGLGPRESFRFSATGRSFIRGDANDDGDVDIADAITILMHLFLGVSAVACDDWGDTDDSGKLELSDAVGLLEFLFTPGPAPALPFPTPDFDPTPDPAACGNL